MRADHAPRDRAGFLQAEGVLLVVREPPPPPPPAPGQPPMVPGNPAEGVEVLVAVWDDGSANGLSGKVDLGTGVATALGQLVAEELELPFERVRMLLGDTSRAPNQGPTIASATLQIASDPLRRAAAQARQWLRAHVDGAPEGLRGQRVCLTLDLNTPLKAPADWRVAGQAQPRVDIPAKVMGEPSFVHDLQLPGMLHGRVLRPPYAGADHGPHIGHTLRGVDEGSVAHIPGIVAIVREGDFVGVVAEREEQAEAAMRALRLDWGDWPDVPPLHDLAQALSTHASTPRVVAERGDVSAANASAPLRLQRRYVWPYQMHASIGPSCAVAHWQGEGLTVWAGTQNPHVLRADLALLTGLADTAVEVVRLEASGCYGRNGADDVAADAALLARALGRPVRVQLTREQEHQWEPKGAAQLMDVDGSVDAEGQLHGWRFDTCYPSNAAPTLALLLTGRVPAVPQAYQMGDRTSVPPYRVPHLKVTVHDMPPILRASWLRGVSALPNSFAHECFMDELAQSCGEDPLAFRLRHLDDERASALLRATAERAGWAPPGKAGRAGQQDARSDWLHGQGLAYARYVHSKFPGFGAAWSAWVADVQVHKQTGEVRVTRVVVGHDAGAMVNPAGVQHQVHGNVVQTTSRALTEQVQLTPQSGTVASRDWGSYPILRFNQVPTIDVLLMPRPDEPILGAGESASVPGTAAIANAIFDATGVRFREPPFTPEVVRAGLHPQGVQAPPDGPVALPGPTPLASASGPTHTPSGKRWGARAVALLTGVLATVAGLMGWRPAIAPVGHVGADVYTAATIERGRVLAALGNCAGCHTAPGGAPYAGGRALDTPFGRITSTNLTPDAQTGLGAWSFSAFQRAMREGVARDGRHLYPAFPYTAFTRMSDEDLTALYAYLRSLPPVTQATPEPALRWPYSLRPLMGVWNALHLEPGPRSVASGDALWQRGEYLVNGPGHCGACHTPRDSLGAERQGVAHLSGSRVEGWLAPSLRAPSAGRLPWTEAALFSYLRAGHAPQGVAIGPMAEVVQGLRAAPDADVRAMARYLASLQGTPEPASVQALAERAIAQARSQAPPPDEVQRRFEAACGACHSEGRAPVDLGLNLPLALNSKLRGDAPDDLIRVLLDGSQRPPSHEVAFMPGFRTAWDDRQLAEMVVWLRRRFAPELQGWGEVEAVRARVGIARGATRADR